MERDEKIGYLEANVEHIAKRQDDILKRLDRLDYLVESKFHTAEVVFKTLKFLGLVVVAVLSLKFGDIPRLWSHFF